MGAAVLNGANSWRIAAVADFDGDGHPDLVWQDPATGQSQVWYLGGAQGTTYSGSAALSEPNSWRIVGAADFDGNGHADLVWQDPATGMSQVWFMGGAQGATVIGAAVLSKSNAWRIARVMDFNGDGHPDLIWQDPVTGQSQAWLLGGTQGATVHRGCRSDRAHAASHLSLSHARGHPQFLTKQLGNTRIVQP